MTTRPVAAGTGAPPRDEPVGAHLPLDMLGGAGLGLAVGAAVRLLLGRPRRPQPAS